MKGMLVKKEENPLAVQDNQDNYVCRKCGCDDVESKMWVNLNTMNVTGDASENIDDNWCNDCQDSCEIVTEDEYVERED